MPEITLSPIRILDSSKIQKQGILERVTDDVPSFIRAVLSDVKRKYFVCTVKENGADMIIGILGLENISSIHKSAECVMYFSSEKELPGISDVNGLFASAFDRLLRYAFFDHQLHRVSILIPSSDLVSEKVLLDCHMRQEALLEEALYVGNKFEDAALFSLLDSEYPDYSVGFVAFKKGVVAVRGDNEVVEMMKFYSYGKEIEGTLERNVAIHTGIADSNGVMKGEGAPEFKDLLDMPFPDEVKRCMMELYEYFSKRRTTFDINAKPLYGSDFQKKVWEKVSDVPYGVTRSYEDIAMDLTGQDKIAARNLTRAVGAACSDNPLPLLVPCHRIIGKDGRLIGFSGGLEIKEYLLNHEMFGIHMC